MRNLLNPRWLIVINTIPIAILLFILGGQYNIIKTLLSPESDLLWIRFGSALLVLGVINLAYTIYAILKKKQISIYYGIVSLLVYILYLYVQNYYTRELITFDIPRWMLRGDIFLHAGTFIMPTLAHALFTVVINVTSENKENHAWKNFLMAIATPLAWYVFFQLILPLWQSLELGFGEHTMIVIFIVSTVTFLFFLARGTYILALKKGAKWKEYAVIWKIFIAIIFPITGLLINNDQFSYLENNNYGIFGDFNSIWFYIIAVVNGITICLPNNGKKNYRLLLFIGRSITFTYTFYFFLVFLPYLPLSILAIIVVGTGFLMLTPLALFIIHVHQLTVDYRFLSNYFPGKRIIIYALIGLSILPLSITATYLRDKHVLNETLDFIYSPDYSKSYGIDKTSLRSTLDVIKDHGGRNRMFSGSKTPYLTSFFNWLVLDNLMLSTSKINKIEQVFYGADRMTFRPENIRNDSVEISGITTSSHYNKEENTWTSWVNLEITNANTNNWFSEYATVIDLPVGCWISDYYLYVGDTKKMGILAEKKSAMWVFSQIRGTNRDPGLLHYLTGNRVSFRVFPFSDNEVRKTGIQFIHKEPIALDIDDHHIRLGNTTEQSKIVQTSSSDQSVVYVSKEEKKKLKKVQRTPYYHFIVDVSSGKKNMFDIYKWRMDALLKQNLINKDNALVTFANTYSTTQSLSHEWAENFHEQSFEGGFFLERALKKELFSAYKNLETSYPIFIIITDDIHKSILEKDLANLKITFPESDLFYVLEKDGYIAPHSFTNAPKWELEEYTSIQFENEILAWPNTTTPQAYLPNDSAASIVLTQSHVKPSGDNIKEGSWQTGLFLQGMWTSQALHPENSEEEWLDLVKYSFQSKIMSPVTSYIVVENEAQEAMLRKKQKEALSGKKSLDLGNAPQRMSEPALWLLVVGIGLYWLMRNRWIWGIIRW